MSRIVQRFLIVHHWSEETVKSARLLALSIFPAQLVGELMSTMFNFRLGFVVWSSGSKDGWREDEQHMSNLKEFVFKLRLMDPAPYRCRIDLDEDAVDEDAVESKHVIGTANAGLAPCVRCGAHIGHTWQCSEPILCRCYQEPEKNQ